MSLRHKVVGTCYACRLLALKPDILMLRWYTMLRGIDPVGPYSLRLWYLIQRTRNKFYRSNLIRLDTSLTVINEREQRKIWSNKIIVKESE